MSDYEAKAKKCGPGGQVKVTVFDVVGMIKKGPWAVLFEAPGEEMDRKDLEKNDDRYYAYFDDEDDKASFVEVFVRFMNGQEVKKEPPIEDCDDDDYPDQAK